MRLCKCGCGKEVLGKENKLYVNINHLMRLSRKKWEIQNPQKSKDTKRKYKITHKKQINIYNKIYSKVYRKNHSQKIKIYQNRWYKLNKEKYRQYKCEKSNLWRKTNRGKILYKKWCLLNKNRLNEWRKLNYYQKPNKKLSNQKRQFMKKLGGELSIATIQLVYEDNIKKYGTLTCYLCEKKIEFRKDHLEHKTPLSRGGTNEYYNLAIACQQCNCKKNTKTEIEYRKELKL